ncbi:MAG: hypothetical protein P1P89_20795 [Desulfobacterales bacterium]|nr:hypothetical protein [Desulfobacterales bacterium]
MKKSKLITLLIPCMITGILLFVCSISASPLEPIHFINVHGHYVPLGPEFPPKSKMAVHFKFDGMPVSEFFASMDRWGVDIFINELSPTSIWKGVTEIDKGLPKMSELYPRRVVSLYGGKALRLLHQVVLKGSYTAQHEKNSFASSSRRCSRENIRGSERSGYTTCRRWSGTPT